MKRISAFIRRAAAVLLLCAASLSVSCNAENDIADDGIEPREETDRTVLAYLVGDINLWSSIEATVNEMEEGWNASCDGTLLIYLDNSPHLTQFGCPVLLEVVHDTTDMIVSRVVKAYEDQDAADPEVMRGVLEDAVRLYPARSHGLIIGTHGSGWIPDLSRLRQTRSLAGPDRYGSVLEVSDLARILPVKYEFILFHACHMANVETVYQLRDKCDYVVASTMILPYMGYPYSAVVPYLYTKPHADLYNFADICVGAYRQVDPARFNGFAVSVVKTSEMERLAGAVSGVLDGLDERGMSYDRMRQCLSDSGWMVDYYEGMLLDIGGLGLLADRDDALVFDKAMDMAVILKGFVEGDDDPEKLARIGKYGTGLSFYLPKFRDTPLHRRLNEVFKRDYEWSEASGFDKERI